MTAKSFEFLQPDNWAAAKGYSNGIAVEGRQVFIAGQVARARIEERKLAETFPEYVEYRRTTGMFFPRLFQPGA